MSEPFLAEIRIVGFNFAPRGWAFCDGQILPINQNQSLYSLLGTTYGGDGRTSFALPDLRGRTPLHRTDAYPLGRTSGVETVTLTAGQIAAHRHVAKVSSAAGDQIQTSGNIPAQSNQPQDRAYSVPVESTMTSLRSGSITNAGGGQAHDNMQPYLTLHFIIALRGLFPSRN